MAELEHATSQEALRLSRQEVAQWFDGQPASCLQAALGRCSFAPGAVEAFSWLHAHEVPTAIASLTWDFAVRHFAEVVGADWWLGTRLDSLGRIDHVWPEDKARWVIDLGHRMGVACNQVAAVGDSWGDIPMLVAVGHPAFVGTTMPAGVSALHVPNGNLYEVIRTLFG